MEIWEMRGDAIRFASFLLEPELDIKFDGSSKLATWVPPHGTFFKQKKYKKGDFARGELLLGTVACNEKALHCLLPSIGAEVEVLPLELDRPGFSLLNVINVIDCLDVESSVVDRSITDGRIMDVDEYAFKEEMLQDTYLFKIPQVADVRTFVTEKFRALITDNHLTGLAFYPLKTTPAGHPKSEAERIAPHPPYLAEVFNDQAQNFYARGDLDGSLNFLNQAIKLKPELAIAHYNLGHLLAEMQRFEEALEAFRHALQLDLDPPKQAAAYYGIGWVFTQQGRLEDSIPAYQDAVRLDPAHAQAHHELGVALGKQEHYARSLQELTTAVSLAPRDARMRHDLGLELYYQGQYKEAIKEFRAAVRLNPDAAAYLGLGTCYDRLHQWDQAIKAYEQAIKLDPTYVHAYANLGSTLRHSGQIEASIAAYRQALALDPHYAEAHSGLGITLVEKLEWREARAEFEQAIGQDPSLTTAYFGLGIVLLQTGQLAEARLAFTKVIELGDDPDLTRSAQEALDDINQSVS